MRFIYTFFIFILFSFPVLSNQQLREVNSEKQWASLIEQAKIEDRYVYVFVYSDICGFCQKMKKKVFVSDSISTIMKDDFLTIKVNSDKEFGQSLITRFDIKDFPVHLFLSNSDTLLNKIDGYLSVDGLYRTAQAMSDFKISAPFYKERFLLGTLDKLKAYEYTKMLFSAGQLQQANRVAQFYLGMVDSRDLLSERCKFIIANFVTDLTSNHFVFLINEETQMVNHFGTGFYDEFVKKGFDVNMREAIADTNLKQVDLIVDKILLTYLNAISFEEGKAGTYQRYYLGTKQWAAYNQSVFDYYHLSEKVTYLREKSEEVIDDYNREIVLLNYAQNWLSIVEKYANDYKTQFLYGTVFLLKGQNKEALKKANKAKKLAKTDEELFLVEELIVLAEKESKIE